MNSVHVPPPQFKRMPILLLHSVALEPKKSSQLGKRYRGREIAAQRAARLPAGGSALPKHSCKGFELRMVLEVAQPYLHGTTLQPRCSDDSNRLAVQNTKDQVFKQNSDYKDWNFLRLSPISAANCPQKSKRLIGTDLLKHLIIKVIQRLNLVLNSLGIHERTNFSLFFLLKVSLPNVKLLDNAYKDLANR